MANRPTFAAWFEQLLEKRKVSQAEASRLLGIGTGRISEWMTGKAVPSSASCRLIAQAFHVEEDEVLIAAGRRSPDPYFDPDSPEAQLLPFIRAVDWSKHAAELAMIKRQLEFIVETDRGEHNR